MTGFAAGETSLFQHLGSRLKKLKKYLDDKYGDVGGSKTIKLNWKGHIDFAMSEKDTDRYLKAYKDGKFTDAHGAIKWFAKYWERPLHLEPWFECRDSDNPTKRNPKGPYVDCTNKKNANHPACQGECVDRRDRKGALRASVDYYDNLPEFDFLRAFIANDPGTSEEPAAAPSVDGAGSKVLIFGHSQAARGRPGAAIKQELEKLGFKVVQKAIGAADDNKLAAEVKSIKENFSFAVLYLDGNDYSPLKRVEPSEPGQWPPIRTIARKAEAKSAVIDHVRSLGVEEKNIVLLVPPVNNDFVKYNKYTRANYQTRVEGHRAAVDFFRRSYPEAMVPDIVYASEDSFRDEVHMDVSAPEAKNLASEILTRFKSAVATAVVKENQMSVDSIFKLIEEVLNERNL